MNRPETLGRIRARDLGADVADHELVEPRAGYPGGALMCVPEAVEGKGVVTERKVWKVVAKTAWRSGGRCCGASGDASELQRGGVQICQSSGRRSRDGSREGPARCWES